MAAAAPSWAEAITAGVATAAPEPAATSDKAVAPLVELVFTAAAARPADAEAAAAPAGEVMGTVIVVDAASSNRAHAAA